MPAVFGAPDLTKAAQVHRAALFGPAFVDIHQSVGNTLFLGLKQGRPIRRSHELESGMGEPKTLLVVEDEPLIRSMLEEMLLDAGFSVHPVENGARAIELMDTIGGTLHCVVTDVRLGAGPNGWTVARYVRGRRPSLPIIYVTGDSAHEWRTEGVSESLLVQKPFVSAQITNAIAHLLN